MPRYIDANKFKKKIKVSDLYGTDAYIKIMNILADTETANVAPPPAARARWIVNEDEGLFICSNPECRAEFDDGGENILDYWRFCPYCGSKMDENRFWKIHR